MHGKTGLPDSGKVASIPAMKTSSKIPRGFMILAVIVVPALSWWGSWRYQAAKEADETRIKAERKHAEQKQQIAQWLQQHQQRQMKDVFAEWKKSSDDISKRLTELEKSRQSVEKGENKDGSLPGNPRLDVIKRQLAELRQKQEELRRRQAAGSLEVLPIIKRTSWNGQTDPDSLWHDQRRQANQILMEHGLPTLDGRGSLPDSPSLPRSPQVGGQK